MRRTTLFKILLFFTFQCSLFTSSVAQTIGDAFYIYRNDGGFNAFFREEIDSMAYSCYDADSVLYDDVVMQVVYTQDSIYRIPLVAIDSVGFVTPETKYQPSVKVIEGEMRDNVISSDGLTIHFLPTTPAHVLPHVGDKLVTTEVSKTFFAGFAGQVESITNDGSSIVVTCTAVGLDEVFEEFYYVSDGSQSEMQVKGERDRRNIDYTWEASYSPGTFDFPLTAPIAVQFKPEDLAYEFSPEASVSVTPTFRGKVALVVSPKLGVVVSIDLSEEDVISENLSLSGAVDWTHDFDAAHVPMFNLGVPFLWFYGEIGAFLRANASVTMDQHWQQKFRHTFHYEVGSKSLFIPRMSFNGITLENNHSGSVLVKGELGAGVYAELGVEFLAKDLLSAGARAEAGIKIGGNTMLYKKDMENALHSTDVYKTLQGNDIHLNGFWSVGLQGQILNWGASHNFDALSGERTFARFSIVPDFSDVKLERDKEDKSVLYASAKASGACLPQDLGFTLFEQEILENGQTSFSRYGYIGTSADFYASYFDMPNDKRYEVYPTVKLFGIDALTFLAEPKTAEKHDELCPDANHPHWIDLGLPSGTQWRCCNEGASAPEAYGGYYQFGQVSSAPSWNQIKELLNYCTYVWTTQNGVYGRKFTGPNGASIFLPAAGGMWSGELYDVGADGYYWSSTPFGESSAYYLGFSSGYAYGDNDGRSYGQSVRPVR